ncbi:ABC-2 transporter permease [Thioalkalivibrio sp. XN279]|uniref:ABC-2 transporter permease n=1 Tax=Thioalkalivibrio sp. XN279 TaxID=2714953 RepID=UPI001F0EA958|nr:ABC-2 transporter permease [Thioalkalivibrio sp. XN279]
MITLLRRELVEHPASWMVPAVLGGLFVVAALFAVFGIARVGIDEVQFSSDVFAEAADPGDIRAVLMVMFLPMAALFAMVISVIIGFYLLDALYADRKDRSILFWKSLPVSDLKTVGSKYLTAIGAMPLQALGVFVATAVLVWLVLGTAGAVAGTSQFLVHGPSALLQAAIVLAYGLVALGLWLAPVHAWLLLVSAYAKRAVLAWATLPPLLVIVAEKTLFDTTYFAILLGQRLSGGAELAFSGEGNAAIEAVDGGVSAVFPALAELLTPGRFLAAPALWAGLVVAAVFFAGAVWLRRWRDDS